MSIQKRNYGLVYFDNETYKTHFIPFLTKKEVYEVCESLDLGKNCVSAVSVVKMVEHWNAYDGLVYPKEDEKMNTEIKERIKTLAAQRKTKCTQLEVSKMTGVSRSHIANFESGRVNNAYLYDFYINNFGGSEHAAK